MHNCSLQKILKLFFVRRIQTRHIICINIHFLYRKIKRMDHFLLYEFVMNSLWFRRYRRNRHQIVTFVTIFSYLLMISGYYFIIRFDYMVILTVYSKFYKNTTQKIEAVLPWNRTATYNFVESGASHYTTRSLPICLELFY